MSRIQVLELPTQVVGDVVARPFILVIDQADENSQFRHLTSAAEASIKEEIGARGLIITADTVELPANDFEPLEEAETLEDVQAAFQIKK